MSNASLEQLTVLERRNFPGVLPQWEGTEDKRLHQRYIRDPQTRPSLGDGGPRNKKTLSFSACVSTSLIVPLLINC